MQYKYLNKFDKTIKVIIEPIFDEFYLEKNELLIIKTDNNTPIDIDIDESNTDIIVLCFDSHFYYSREIKLINGHEQ